MAQLLQQEKTHCIDLRAFLWSPGVEEKLEKYLGRGKVTVELNALVKSIFYETQDSGVWVVSHYNQEGEITSKLIVIIYLHEITLFKKRRYKERS